MHAVLPIQHAMLISCLAFAQHAALRLQLLVAADVVPLFHTALLTACYFARAAWPSASCALTAPTRSGSDTQPSTAVRHICAGRGPQKKGPVEPDRGLNVLALTSSGTQWCVMAHNAVPWHQYPSSYVSTASADQQNTMS